MEKDLINSQIILNLHKAAAEFQFSEELSTEIEKVIKFYLKLLTQ